MSHYGKEKYKPSLPSICLCLFYMKIKTNVLNSGLPVRVQTHRSLWLHEYVQLVDMNIKFIHIYHKICNTMIYVILDKAYLSKLNTYISLNINHFSVLKTFKLPSLSFQNIECAIIIGLYF